MVPKDSSGKEIKEDMTLIDSKHKRTTYKVIRGDFANGTYGEGSDLIADGGFIKTKLSHKTTDTPNSVRFTIVEDAHEGLMIE